MEIKSFNFKIVAEDGKTTETGFNLYDYVTYVKEEDKLFVFLRHVREKVEPTEVPIKGKPTKDNPSGWTMDVQMRNTKSLFAISIPEQDDIERFMTWVKSTGV